MTPHPQGNGKPGDVPETAWLLSEAARQLNLHNAEYKHRTPEKFIAQLLAAAATPQPAIPPGFKVVRKCPHNWQNWVNHHNGTNAPWCPQCCIDPLSAAPVPEAWQGVSDEQIDAIAEAQDDEGWFVGQLTKLEWRAFARAVLSAANLSPAPPQSAQLMEPK